MDAEYLARFKAVASTLNAGYTASRVLHRVTHPIISAGASAADLRANADFAREVEWRAAHPGETYRG